MLPPFRYLKVQKSAFTLSELLIALAILGLIATFTIPKVLQGVETGKKNAVFKETIATFNAIGFEGWQTGQLNASTEYGPVESFFNSKLASVKYCPQFTTKANCWTWDYSTDPSNTVLNDYPSWILANGAVVCIQTAFSFNVYQLYIDWNGSAPPNLIGQDQLYLLMPITGPNSTLRAGQLAPPNNIPANLALYNSIFGP